MATQAVRIWSNGSYVVDIDHDEDTSNAFFKITKDNAGATLFSIGEDGAVVFSNGVSINAAGVIAGYQLDLEDNAVTLATIQTTATGAEYAGLNVKSPVGTWGLYTGTTSHSLIAGDFGIFDWDAEAYRFVIKDDGKVGIGTTSPQRELHVVSTGWAEIRIDGSSGGVLELYDGATALASIYSESANKNLIFRTNGATEQVRILSNGNVGIGTNDPKTKITVEGTITLKEQAAADTDAAAYGQLWVKTASPNELYFTDDEGTDHKIAYA